MHGEIAESEQAGVPDNLLLLVIEMLYNPIKSLQTSSFLYG